MTNRKKKVLFYESFEDWIDTYKVGAIREVTLQKYYHTAKVVREIAPDLLLCDLDRRAYQNILNEYALTHEKQTTTDFHHQLKACIKDLFHDGLLERDPTYRAIIKGKPPKNKKSKFLQTEELRMLISSLELMNGINYDWFILIAAKTGLRFSEVLALTPEDFDFKENTLNVSKTWDYKNESGGFQKTKTQNSVRKIGIDWQIAGQFQPLIAHLPKEDPIFVGREEDGAYKRIFNSTINNHLAAKCKKINIPVISLHSLRHTHASVLLAAGVSIHSISSRLGHADISVTQETYAHVLDELKAADDQKVMATMMQLM